MAGTEDLLFSYAPISLADMGDIKLMNRLDTKYVMTKDSLDSFLGLAAGDYLVQDTDGCRSMPYHTIYLDTPDRLMYMMHQSGRRVREKIRVRTYEHDGATFLEVKNKNNKGRTDKKRMRVSSLEGMAEEGGDDFLGRYAWYRLDDVIPQLENRFKRITLVNKGRSERLTIDRDIWFRDLSTGREFLLDNIVVVELKRDGRRESAAKAMLHSLHVRPSGFSKYIMGSIFTDPQLKHNRLKPRLRRIITINNKNNGRI